MLFAFAPLFSFLCLRTPLFFFIGKGGTTSVAVLGLEMEPQFGVLGGDMEHEYSEGFKFLANKIIKSLLLEKKGYIYHASIMLLDFAYDYQGLRNYEFFILNPIEKVSLG